MGNVNPSFSSLQALVGKQDLELQHRLVILQRAGDVTRLRDDSASRWIVREPQVGGSLELIQAVAVEVTNTTERHGWHPRR